MQADPRLKRVVNHDPRSRNFAFKTSPQTPIVSVTHQRYIGILNQGNVGSCTGNTGVGALGSKPLYTTKPTAYTLDQAGALKLYSDAKVIDGTGAYPPNDTGSSGLSIAKALYSHSLISRYEHTFTLADALAALMSRPILVGFNWYEDMFRPDVDGRVHITGLLAGGHEVLCRQVDAERSRVWFDNSWGSAWGVGGRFYLTFEDFGTLLSQQGDVIVLVPPLPPAPQVPPAPQTPVSTTDRTLAISLRRFLTSRESSLPSQTATRVAITTWLRSKKL